MSIEGKNKNLLFPRLLRAGAILSSTVALFPALAEARDSEEPPRAPEVIAPTKELIKTRELPGYHMIVSKEQREQIRASTVLIVERSKSESEDFNRNCSGTKIRYQDKEYIISAAHCVARNLKGEQPLVSVETDGWPAQNVVDVDNTDYFVSNVDDPFFNPIADVKGISIPITTKATRAKDLFGDWALLTATVEPKGGPAPRDYRDIPALNYDAKQPVPAPGEQVALTGNPATAGHHLVAATGRYLGRIKPLFFGKELDLVGIAPAGPRADACNFGASGSSALLSSGYISGPLAFRANAGYPSRKPNPGEDIKLGAQNIAYLQELTGIDLKPFVTLCLFEARTRNPKNSSADTMNALIKGLNHFPVPVPTPPGQK